MSNIIKFVVLAMSILSASFVLAADSKPLSPTEQRAMELEAEAKAAKADVEKERAMKKLQAKAEWNSKSFTEAWGIRGQAVVDATQWTGGRALQYTAKADANVVHYGFTVPAAYIASTAASVASGAQSYADGAFDNRPKTEVAVKVGDAEVKASVPTPETK